MQFIFQIIFGSYFGWMASGKLLSKPLAVTLGIFGAMLGNFCMDALSMPGITGYNLYSFIVAMIGSVLTLFLGKFAYSFLRNYGFLMERRFSPR